MYTYVYTYIRTHTHTHTHMHIYVDQPCRHSEPHIGYMQRVPRSPSIYLFLFLSLSPSISLFLSGSPACFPPHAQEKCALPGRALPAGSTFHADPPSQRQRQGWRVQRRHRMRVHAARLAPANSKIMTASGMRNGSPRTAGASHITESFGWNGLPLSCSSTLRHLHWRDTRAGSERGGGIDRAVTAVIRGACMSADEIAPARTHIRHV